MTYFAIFLRPNDRNSTGCRPDNAVQSTAESREAATSAKEGIVSELLETTGADGGPDLSLKIVVRFASFACFA
jgi:hypothetical protein